MSHIPSFATRSSIAFIAIVVFLIALATSRLSDASSSASVVESVLQNQNDKTQKRTLERKPTLTTANSGPALPAVTTITATLTDNVATGTKVLPGSTINYTVNINSTGTTAAAAVAFNDVLDINTTLVAGSVKASPIAVDDSYNTIGNVNISLPAAQGVIQNNDLNPNVTGTLEVSQVNATAVPSGGMATAATTHGSVTMHSDGSFDYTPTAGFTGANDTFTYTLGNGTGLTDTATVTIAIAGKIWFVNSAAGVNGDGRLGTPFNILTGAGSVDSVDAANDVIFLYTSGTNYTGGITLNSAEKIIGQGASQSILTITGFTAPSGTNLLPATNNVNDPVITTAGTVAVTLGANNDLRGFTVGDTGAAGTDISGSSFGTLTVRDLSVKGTGRALNLATGTIASGSTFDLIETTGGDKQRRRATQHGRRIIHSYDDKHCESDRHRVGRAKLASRNQLQLWRHHSK